MEFGDAVSSRPGKTANTGDTGSAPPSRRRRVQGVWNISRDFRCRYQNYRYFDSRDPSAKTTVGLAVNGLWQGCTV
jgi:hypothetical protein